MKNKFYDINKLPADGYMVMPLSMSRLSIGHGQGPEECFEMIKYFEDKVSQVGIDFLFIYTNGLYFNNDESALLIRKKTNSQMIEHKNRIWKLLVKSKKYIPQSAHFIPWDYVLLNSHPFQEYYLKLQEAKDSDRNFLRALKTDLGGREMTEANLNFLIEEVVVTHLIREKMIDFPKTLVKNDNFRLIIYPGKYLNADVYQWQNDILPKNKENNNPYAESEYDFAEKVLVDFKNIDL